MTKPNRFGKRISGESLVCVLQRFLASDVEPFAFDLKRFHGLARVEPLHKTAGLIRIISGSEIGC